MEPERTNHNPRKAFIISKSAKSELSKIQPNEATHRNSGANPATHKLKEPGSGPERPQKDNQTPERANFLCDQNSQKSSKKSLNPTTLATETPKAAEQPRYQYLSSLTKKIQLSAFFIFSQFSNFLNKNSKFKQKSYPKKL